VVDSKDKERLLSLYEGRLEEYGHDVKTVGWGSVEDQYFRFDMLLRGVDCNNKSILDLGCGLGDFVGYLKQKNIKNFTYTGIDLSKKIIEKAKEKYQDNSCHFFAKNVLNDELPKADIVIISGMLTFNIKGTKVNIRKIMQKMFDSTNEILAINFMSTYVDFELEKNLHFPPEEIFNHAKKITQWVNIYHDYPLYEFTIQLKR
jgi:SAM-dependent methyltransferase